MMAKARFTIHIPRHDELGNPLRVAEATHHYVFHGPWRIDSAQVSHGHPYDALHIYADDIPENDSAVKQLAVFAGELANVPSVSAAKDGKHINAWTLTNKHYRPGEPAEQGALADPGVQPLTDSIGNSITESPGIDPTIGQGDGESIVDPGPEMSDVPTTTETDVVGQGSGEVSTGLHDPSAQLVARRRRG